MSNVIDLPTIMAQRQQIAEMMTIVLADTFSDAFAEYCEAPDDEAFSETLHSIGEAMKGELASAEMLQEYYWWAVARRFAIRNGIEQIDAEFCRSFDPLKHHSPTLQWARKYLDGLPALYGAFLGGAS
jgi:hypothetical protein